MTTWLLQKCSPTMRTCPSVSFWVPYSFAVLRAENGKVWLYSIELVRGVCQSVHATQCAWRDWCFCHPPASKLLKKSRLMQIEKPRQASSQTKEGEPHCSSLHVCFFFVFFLRNIWGFCFDAHWAQMNTDSESCIWEWVSAWMPFFQFS